MDASLKSTQVWIIGEPQRRIPVGTTVIGTGTLPIKNIGGYKDRVETIFLPTFSSQMSAQNWAICNGETKSTAIATYVDSIALIGTILANDKTKAFRYVVSDLKPIHRRTISILDDSSPNQRTDLSNINHVSLGLTWLFDQLEFSDDLRIHIEFFAERLRNVDPRDLLHNTSEIFQKALGGMYGTNTRLALDVALGKRGVSGAIAWKTLRPKVSCTSCGERCWQFIKLSPNHVSALWSCEFCGKRVTIRQSDDDSGSMSSTRLITKSVQHEVWRRDEGKCVMCGSRNKLEFDHIIPVAKGGSNTARNVQLLCESCNRSKAAKAPDEGY